MFCLVAAVCALWSAMSTSTHDRAMVTHDCTAVLSSSLCECADRRLYIAGSSRFFFPRQRRSSAAVLGVLNAHSAVNNAALLHDVIADHQLGMSVVTETWMKSSYSPAITKDIAPRDFQVLHRCRCHVIVRQTDGPRDTITIARPHTRRACCGCEKHV